MDLRMAHLLAVTALALNRDTGPRVLVADETTPYPNRAAPVPIVSYKRRLVDQARMDAAAAKRARRQARNLKGKA